jgi:fructose/tagatose bisphosphate aldolase
MEFGQTLRRQFADDPKEFDRIKLFGPCMEAVKDKAVQKMELL